MKTFLLAASLLLITPRVLATIAFDLQAEQLRTAGPIHSAAPTTTLVMLVADTGNNGFGSISSGSSLSVGSFLNLDDQIVYKSDIASTSGISGVFGGFPTLTLGGAWQQGNSLALVWFPTYTTSTSQTSLGDSYGLYTNPVSGVDGSDAWVTPADGAFGYKLYAFTSSAVLEHAGGSNPDSAGDASLLVVPEPSVSCLVLGGTMCITLGRRRRLSEQ